LIERIELQREVIRWAPQRGKMAAIVPGLVDVILAAVLDVRDVSWILASGETSAHGQRVGEGHVGGGAEVITDASARIHGVRAHPKVSGEAAGGWIRGDVFHE